MPRPGSLLSRRSLRTLLIAVALLTSGAGSLVIGSGLAVARTEVAGGNLPVNAGAIDRLDISANSSPSLVRNPLNAGNLAVANRVDTPRFSCALHTSFDAGVTWAPTAIPFPAGEELPERCYAPDAAFGAGGILYLSFVTLKGLGNTPNAGWVSSSRDGGRTLSAPVRVLGPLAFQVRLVADPARTGRLYLSWLQAATTGSLALTTADNPIDLARSDDGGATWQGPVRVNARSRQEAVAPSLAMGPNGELYVLYIDLRDDPLDYLGAHGGRGGEPARRPWALVLARSLDRGGTWAETVVEERLVPAERFIVFIPPTPALAVDPAGGRIYAAFHDAREGDADVWLWTSADGGNSFSAARRVNDTPEHDGTSQYLPALAVAPGGRLDVIYYDRRSDPHSNALNEVSLQSSLNSGKTFLPRVAISDHRFDSRAAYGGERQMPDLGSRLAVLATETRALAMWTDTRAGNESSHKEDLAKAIVAFSSESPARQPLRLAGLALIALGAVTLILWLCRPSRRSTLSAD